MAVGQMRTFPRPRTTKFAGSGRKPASVRLYFHGLRSTAAPDKLPERNAASASFCFIERKGLKSHVRNRNLPAPAPGTHRHRVV